MDSIKLSDTIELLLLHLRNVGEEEVLVHAVWSDKTKDFALIRLSLEIPQKGWRKK